MFPIARRVQIFQGQRFQVDPKWKDRLSDIGIAADLDWSVVAGGRLVSRSDVTRCFRIELDDGEVIYFKRYVYPLKKIMEFWMRPGKASVEAWAYGQLQQLGIPTLDVIAFGERRLMGMLVATFIVTKEMPDTQDMSDFAIDVWSRLPMEERKAVYRDISGKLVQQVRRAHDGGFFHHDLKWRNILLKKDTAGYTPVWIDSPRASRMRFREHRGVIVDLSGLARIAVSLLSKYDRMRFVCQYLGRDRRPGDASRLYRQVARHLGRRPPKPILLPEQDISE